MSLDADVAAIGKLPAGVYVQIYRAKVPGDTREERLALLDQWLAAFKARGARGVVWHGFTSEMTVDVLAALTALCRKHGLLSLAAFGMDSATPKLKAERIGHVLVSDVCDGVLLDAEGAWEDDRDGDDRAHAREFVDALKPFRARAPHKVIVDQPWPVPVRTRGQGGHTRFPFAEFCEVIDAHAEQDYVNDWKGPDRYESCMVLFNESWSKLQAKLAALGLKLPRWRTIQGYGWGDIPDGLEDFLERYSTVLPVFVWGEPFPDSAFMATWLAWWQRRSRAQG